MAFPQAAYCDGMAFLFGGYTDSTVDVTVVGPDSTSITVAGVQVPADALQALQQGVPRIAASSLLAAARPAQMTGHQAAQAVRHTSYALDIVFCAASGVLLSVCPGSGPLAVPCVVTGVAEFCSPCARAVDHLRCPVW